VELPPIAGGGAGSLATHAPPGGGAADSFGWMAEPGIYTGVRLVYLTSAKACLRPPLTTHDHRHVCGWHSRRDSHALHSPVVVNMECTEPVENMQVASASTAAVNRQQMPSPSHSLMAGHHQTAWVPAVCWALSTSQASNTTITTNSSSLHLQSCSAWAGVRPGCCPIQMTALHRVLPRSRW
jgi:hypothetical protein